MKLTQPQTKLLVEHILELGARGFPPWVAGIDDMANALLAENDRGPVGPGWARDFVRRQPELPVKFSDRYGYSLNRSRRSEVDVINGWFTLVKNVKAKYSIQDDDMYNFDEYVFEMGPILRGVFQTGSDRRRHPNQRLSSRKWITVLQGLSATGWVIPPFLISASSRPLSVGNKKDEIPLTWAVRTSENGLTTDEAAIAWLEHFDKHTKRRVVGTYRLLILGGHESHNSLQFQRLCQQKKIVTICVPHSFCQQLQPLNVGYFPPLQKAYQNKINDLQRHSTGSIKPEAFLPAFIAAFNTATTEQNVCAGFRNAGLVPYNPDAVLSKRPVERQTPIDLTRGDPWFKVHFPTSVRQTEAQPTVAQNQTQQHKSPSLPSRTESSNRRLKRAMEEAIQSLELLHKKIDEIRAATRATTELLNREGESARSRNTTLTRRPLVASKGSCVQKAGKKSAKRVRAERHCRGCGRAGHDLRNCM